MATHSIHDFAYVGAGRKMSGGIKVYSVKVSLFNISTSTAAGCQRIWLGIEIGFGQLNCLFLNLWMIALKKKFLKKTSRITKLPVHAFLFARISSETRHFLILGKFLSSLTHIPDSINKRSIKIWIQLRLTRVHSLQGTLAIRGVPIDIVSMIV